MNKHYSGSLRIDHFYNDLRSMKRMLVVVTMLLCKLEFTILDYEYVHLVSVFIVVCGSRFCVSSTLTYECTFSMNVIE